MDTVAGGIGFLLGYVCRLMGRRGFQMVEPAESEKPEVQGLLSDADSTQQALSLSAAKLRLLATAFVGFVLFVATTGILILAFLGRDIPPALSALAGTAMGALVPHLTASSKQ